MSKIIKYNLSEKEISELSYLFRHIEKQDLFESFKDDDSDAIYSLFDRIGFYSKNEIISINVEYKENK